MAATSLTPFDDAFWSGQRAMAFDPAIGAFGPPAWIDDREREALVWFQTSGSEGRPKRVGLSRSALLASATAVNTFLDVMTTDTWLRALPSFHVGGFGVEARAWAARSRLVRDDGKWNALRFVDTCTRDRVTLTSLVPAQVFDLVDAGLAAPSSVRAVVVGGGPLRPALWQCARDLGWPVLTSYGLTEAGSQVATLRRGQADPAGLTVLPHWQVSVSADGCLELSGPALATCYLKQDAGGRWSRVEIGSRLATADRVNLEPAPGGSILHFLGRRDRTVKILGELLDLEAVDAVVADAAAELGHFGRVCVRSEVDDRAGHHLVLECLDQGTGRRVSELIAPRLPAWAQFAEVRVVEDLRLSELGKPVV